MTLASATSTRNVTVSAFRIILLLVFAVSASLVYVVSMYGEEAPQAVVVFGPIFMALYLPTVLFCYSRRSVSVAMLRLLILSVCAAVSVGIFGLPGGINPFVSKHFALPVLVPLVFGVLTAYGCLVLLLVRLSLRLRGVRIVLRIAILAALVFSVAIHVMLYPFVFYLDILPLLVALVSIAVFVWLILDSREDTVSESRVTNDTSRGS